ADVYADSVAIRMDSLARRLRVVFADSLRPRMDSLREHLSVIYADSLAPRLRAAQRALARARVQVLSAPGEVSVVTLGMRGVAGAEFAEVDPSLGAYFGTDYGALVLRAAPDTPAARSGLRPGDVVVEADGRPVSSVHDLRAAVLAAQRAHHSSVKLRILRKHDRQSVTLRWE
ncbi:MAG TPA: PDZ domain-containing protein, partial [Longimicrobiaceae bacterium]|nr:PDZ domain-containing protein [Longimicrobiaceae bacterium]